jgi:hypothetical protein
MIAAPKTKIVLMVNDYPITSIQTYVVGNWIRVSPAALGLLLMLWTAPPPAR